MSTLKIVMGSSAVTVLAVTALAGCKSTSTASGTVAASGGVTVSASAAVAGASSPANAPSGAATQAAAGSACTTSDLSLQVIQGAQDGSSTSGDFYIQLTNTSKRTCTLYGFPGVDLTDNHSNSLGIKDNWSVKLAMGGSEATQTLAPGDASASYVTYPVKPHSATAGYPHAFEVRVIPPGQETALTAKIDNLYAGDIAIPVVTPTLNVGPMDIDGVPHR
jgi:hypothetical protein